MTTERRNELAIAGRANRLALRATWVLVLRPLAATSRGLRALRNVVRRWGGLPALMPHASLHFGAVVVRDEPDGGRSTTLVVIDAECGPDGREGRQ